MKEINLKSRIGGLGKLFWDFIRYLSTRNFGFGGDCSLNPILTTSLAQNQSQEIYYSALDTYYSIAAIRKFDFLPNGNSQDDVTKPQKSTYEGLTFVIELPISFFDTYHASFKNIATKCGLQSLACRKKSSRKGNIWSF